MARPRLPQQQIRRKAVQTTLSAEDYHAIVHAAQASHTTLATWLRQFVFQRTMQPSP
ncbi:hypothetical protein SAMN00768000_3738 [Sulfobacillus thermosulfidooxidans DSM 9293]|uniref:Uncharacterized protein n=1 Tax=Sulfobacillus thermosulfidooxidans (strain DSM 9293 / VKM B-1269 / AT-1) TaxID=929705 RepID=A0A1W1WPR4_SULTA|nr:hypothetical protein [Sulfobacillus thermosulfidooxidans]SMC08199.1 hypothetical protein SAMN00768000_3738 [Sulfobacillus thermosulfidooxidans DSM 9293]